MDLFSFPPIAATLDAAYSFLLWLAAILEPLAGTASAAAAIVLITLLLRAALIPVGIAQAKGEQVRARIAPKLLALQKRHKNDRERLQRETMKLYSDENTSPLAGLLPVLIQVPVIGVIYALFIHTTIAGHGNALLLHQLLGVPLGASAAGMLGAGTLALGPLAVFALLVAAIAVVAEVTRRRLRPPSATAAVAGSARIVNALHFTTAVVALFVPLAAGVYLLVTVTWTLVQRLILRRRYPLDLPQGRRAER